MTTPIQLYVLHLNPTASGMTDRYAVMRLAKDGSLSPLWGDYLDADPGNDRAWAAAGRKSAKAWPYMVYAPRPAHGPDKWPAFHFALQGCGYSKLQELAEGIAQKIGYPVDLMSVTGYQSSVTHGQLRGKPISRKAALAKLNNRA